MNERLIRCIRPFAAGAILLASVFAGSMSVGVRPAAAHHNQQLIICYVSCSGYERFTNYDYRQSGWGDVDWPTGFVFKQNASVDIVKNGICSGTSNAWKYCTSGGPMYMYVEQLSGANAPVPAWSGFDQDSGRKRFSQDCGNPNWTAHVRIYAPPQNLGYVSDAFFDLNNGFMAVASSHLDYKDSGGCSGRTHGISEIAENWMIGTMTGVPGWSVSYNTLVLSNSNANHTVNRTLSGVAVPHIYDNDGLGTLVTM